MTKKCEGRFTDQLLIKQNNLKQTGGIPWLMYFCAFSADLPLISVGSCLVWSSPAIPKLQSNDTEINPLGEPISPLQTSIIASASAFTAIFSLLLASKVSNLLGRRKSLILHSSLLAICLSGIAMAWHIYFYYIFFLLNGFNLSSIYINATIYNSEVADNKNRAWMGCILGLSLPLGTLMGFFFGTFTSIRVYTLLCATPTFIYLLLSFFTVESPMYLLYKNKNAEALNILKKLRTHYDLDDIQLEFKKIKDLSLEIECPKNNCCDIFSTYSSRKAMLISSLLCFFQQACGIFTVLAFSGTIFNAAGASVSSHTVSILMGSMQILVAIVIVSSVNKVGRRPLILSSLLGCSLSTLMLGIYFYLKSYYSVGKINWLPVVCAITFISSYALGLGPITGSYISELFPNETRAKGMCVASVIDATVAFADNFGFPLLMELIGIHGCMFIYSAFALLGFLICFGILPETTGKGFNEIQSMLKKSENETNINTNSLVTPY